MATPTYDNVVKAYHEAVAHGEPCYLRMRMIKRTKAVSRKVGRLLRRGLTKKGNVVVLFMKKDFGAVVI